MPFAPNIKIAVTGARLCGKATCQLLAVRPGSDWFIALDQWVDLLSAEGRPDVMNQVVPFEVHILKYLSHKHLN